MRYKGNKQNLTEHIIKSKNNKYSAYTYNQTGVDVIYMYIIIFYKWYIAARSQKARIWGFIFLLNNYSIIYYTCIRDYTTVKTDFYAITKVGSTFFKSKNYWWSELNIILYLILYYHYLVLILKTHILKSMLLVLCNFNDELLQFWGS